MLITARGTTFMTLFHCSLSKLKPNFFASVVQESNFLPTKRCFHRSLLMNYNIITKGPLLIMLIIFPIGILSFRRSVKHRIKKAK